MECRRAIPLSARNLDRVRKIVRVNRPARLAVFVSGGGTNLQALLDRFNVAGSALARVELVVASRPGTRAEARARAVDVPVRVVETPRGSVESVEQELLELLEKFRIDLIVLAGYLKLVPAAVVARYSGAMLNIHPALLPAFGGPGMYGLRVHEAVIAAGSRVSGATIHLVDERYDEGTIIAQWPVPVLPEDTPESLASRVLEVEHMLLPSAIETLVLGHPPLPCGVSRSFELVDAAAPNPESVRRLNS